MDVLSKSLGISTIPLLYGNGKLTSLFVTIFTSASILYVPPFLLFTSLITPIILLVLYVTFLANVYKDVGKIDYVINTAGVLKIGKLLDRKIEDIEKDININYIGAINVAKASIPYLKKTSGGMLMFASSSYTRGRALYSTYSSTKAGIVNLVQALSEELISDCIRINTINPERTATPMRFKAFGKEPEGSLLDVKNVAEASLRTLLSDLTGQVVDVRRSDCEN